MTCEVTDEHDEVSGSTKIHSHCTAERILHCTPGTHKARLRCSTAPGGCRSGSGGCLQLRVKGRDHVGRPAHMPREAGRRAQEVNTRWCEHGIRVSMHLPACAYACTSSISTPSPHSGSASEPRG